MFIAMCFQHVLKTNAEYKIPMANYSNHCGLYLRLLYKVCLYLWDMSIVSIIWNNPTGLQLIVTIFHGIQYFSIMLTISLLLYSFAVLIEYNLNHYNEIMNGVIWSGHIKQKCEGSDTAEISYTRLRNQLKSNPKSRNHKRN
jgi:hypothetical protein